MLPGSLLLLASPAMAQLGVTAVDSTFAAEPQPIEVLGSGFSASTQLTIGGQPAAVLTSAPDRLTVQPAPSIPGFLDVVVAEGGQGAELAGGAGEALKLVGGRLLMGNPHADVDRVVNAAMADLFERNGAGSWFLADRFEPIEPTVDQRAGFGVGLGEGWVLLGALGPLQSSADANDRVDVLYRYSASGG